MKVAKIISNNYFQKSVKDNYKNQNPCRSSNDKNDFFDHRTALAAYNRSFISFKAYCGDAQPAMRLYWMLSGTNEISGNQYIKEHLFKEGKTGNKKWSDLPACELLKMNPKDSIEAICTLNGLNYIPSSIDNPNYGDRWGRRANYIEINPRTIAYTEGETKNEGLLNLIKLLPAIPPSPKSFANCIILSQLYPCINNDGKTGDSSLYSVDLKKGISKVLTSPKLSRNDERMKPEEQVKAFNDLAHIRGLKTGIRMPLSAGQIEMGGKPFDWYAGENDFIDACCDAVDMGFDAIFFDSAKHVGDFEMEYYCGVGELPNFKQMQHITEQIRKRTGRNDISLIGEKCSDHPRFKEMGLTAGNDWSNAHSANTVFFDCKKQEVNDEYAAGPTVSDDNDIGDKSLSLKLLKIRNVLSAFENVGYRLPSYMQLDDIFPLCKGTNTHLEMLEGHNFSAFSDVVSHYNNTFDNSEETNIYRQKVLNEFLNVMYE